MSEPIMRPEHKTYAMCLHGEAHISAKWGWIREIKVSMESGKHAGHI